MNFVRYLVRSSLSHGLWWTNHMQPFNTMTKGNKHYFKNEWFGLNTIFLFTLKQLLWSSFHWRSIRCNLGFTRCICPLENWKFVAQWDISFGFDENFSQRNWKSRAKRRKSVSKPLFTQRYRYNDTLSFVIEILWIQPKVVLHIWYALTVIHWPIFFANDVDFHIVRLNVKALIG